MPFVDTNSVTAANLNNMKRGLFQDNSDNAHTGDTNETALASTVISGGTIGATGNIEIWATGTTTGTTDTKTIKLDFGSATIATVAIASGTAAEWIIHARVFNTATGAQRCIVVAHEAAAVEVGDYITTSEDTTANVTVRVTATLGGTTDTITQTMLSIDIQQIS